MSQATLLYVLAFLIVLAFAFYPRASWSLFCGTVRFLCGVVVDAFLLLLAWI